MAAHDIEFKVKPHSHPGILAVSLLALAVSAGSVVMQACPPVPVPAAAPLESQPVPAPVVAAPEIVAPVPKAEVPAPAPAASLVPVAEAVKGL